MDWIGLDWFGLVWIGLDWLGLVWFFVFFGCDYSFLHFNGESYIFFLFVCFSLFTSLSLSSFERPLHLDKQGIYWF